MGKRIRVKWGNEAYVGTVTSYDPKTLKVRKQVTISLSLSRVWRLKYCTFLLAAPRELRGR